MIVLDVVERVKQTGPVVVKSRAALSDGAGR